MTASFTGSEAAIGEIAERIGPAVVGLGRGWGRGSGVVFAEGHVLTNAHNLGDEDPSVVFVDGRRAPAQVVGVDRDLDLAVLGADTTGVMPVTWDPDRPAPSIGTPVLALANPGGRGLRVTAGHVATAPRSFRGPRGRRVLGGIEHTAPLPRGSSGAPLVDVSGRLLGVNTIRLEGGLILAVPADAAVHQRIAALARGEAPSTRRIGVAVAPPPAARRLREAVGLPDRAGLLVRAVEPGSAADNARLLPGDLIVAADGAPVDSLDALHGALDGLEGEAPTLVLTLVRGADEREAVLEFGGGGPRR